MSKIIIVAPNAAEAVNRAENIGLTRDDISIVTNIDRMRGHKDMLMLYIKALKTNSGHDFVVENK